MNKKEFPTYEELEAFVQPMIAEQKWAIDVRQNTNTGVYMACWIEHKSYEVDGVKEPDEIWTNRNGEMTCVQDLDPEHAKNILRMILRAEREQRAFAEQLLKQMAAAAEPEETAPAEAPKHTLH